jgi:hypothetical protein
MDSNFWFLPAQFALAVDAESNSLLVQLLDEGLPITLFP